MRTALSKRIWLTAAALMVAAGAVALFYITNQAEVNAAAAEPALQTATVRRGSIVISATGAGTVIPATAISLSLDTGGLLTELPVVVGDEVAAGDVLARVDDTDLRQALANAEIQLAQAAMQVDAAVTEAGVSYSDISVEQARLTLEQAHSDLDDLLNWEPEADEIALAEANLAAAEAGYNAARGQEAASGASITVNQISVDQAERNLAAAQAAYDTAYDPGREWELGDPRRADRLAAEREAADETLLRAQESLAIAQANYSSAVSSTNRSSSTSAESNLLNAQQALLAAQSGPDEQEIEAARLAVTQAELTWQQAILNQESANLSLSQARLNVEAAEADLEGVTLLAPMAGTVMAVNAVVGEQAVAPLIALADLSQPMLEVYMDETDLDVVAVGFAVEVVFDALPDETFAGRIVQVDPMLSTVNGVAAVRVVVQLDAFAKPQTLPVGLNATVEVIGGRAENTLLVPVEALRELSPGEFALFVIENGEPRLRLVEVGLMDFTFAEILSGVEAGDVVSTGIVVTDQ